MINNFDHILRGYDNIIEKIRKIGGDIVVLKS
jgi:UDP-N-acetylglucosamine enolpyruvyl transferase